ncbi:MAG: hypothetical protein IIY55_00055 [Blautia sp.]|nr:hypothetical protein [Blautia sp.]
MAIVKCYDRKRDITYVYDSTCFFDEEQGKYRYKRRLIGKINPETGETVPTGKHGGYHPKKEEKPGEQAVLEPLRPGRKKKMPDDEKITDEAKLEEALETIRRLKEENTEYKRKYLCLEKQYNSLVSGLVDLIPKKNTDI